MLNSLVIDEETVFWAEVRDIDNPVCLFISEEELINLKIEIFIRFTKWYLKSTYHTIEYSGYYWQSTPMPMDAEFQHLALSENLSFWLENYTGSGLDYPETFADLVERLIEEFLCNYFLEENLLDSDDFHLFRLSIEEYLIQKVRERTGREVFDQTVIVAKAELRKEEEGAKRRAELRNSHLQLVRQFQEAKLPWTKEYVDKPTWKKLNRANELINTLAQVDQATAEAILNVGLPCLCSNSVREEINQLIRQYLVCEGMPSYPP